MNKPDIRFSGFNGDWTEKKLGDICEFSKGHGYSKKDLTSEGTPAYLYGQMYTNYKTSLVTSDIFVQPQSGSVYSTGKEVILPASGETPEDIARATAVLSEGIILGGDLNIVVPPKDLSQLFLALSISYEKNRNKLAEQAQGATITHLHNSDIAKLSIKYPESAEQKKLGALFSQIDSLIASTQKEHEKLVALKKCMLQKMFPKKGSPVPEIRFKGFTGDWIQQKFGYILEELTERTTSDQEDVLLTSAIDGVFLNSEYFSHQRGQSTIGYKKIVKNTLILSAQNLHLGNANVNLKFEHGIISPAYNCYLLINCVPEFISAWVKRDSTKQFFFDATTVGASVCRRNVDWNLLYNQFLQIPTIEEQQKIGSYFQNLDNLISKQSAELEKLKNVKKTLLSKMFV